MDYGLLVIFLCAGSWLYACALLAVNDALWNRGRIIQNAICAVFGGWLVITKRTGAEYAAIVAFLTFATFFLPVILRRRIAELLSKRKVDRARFLERILSALLWRKSSVAFPVLERLCSVASSPWLLGPGGSRWLERLIISPSRKAFLEGQITAWTAVREYAPALEVFEEEYGPGKITPDAGLLYTISAAYAEAGNLQKAAHYLRRAEETQDAPNPFDVRRFIAAMHVYAHAGRVYAVERLLNNNPAVVAALPSAYTRLWRGVALLNHGEPEVARAVLTGAVARQGPGDEWLIKTAEHYLELAQAPQPKSCFDSTLCADLDAIETLEERPSVSALSPKPGWRPYVTWGLMAVCAVVFVMMNLAGSSEDPYTLARFGANASQMVRLGDWWRLVTSIFIHVGPLHLFFNLYAFYLFGPFIERLVGRWEAFVIFMLSGIAGAAASAWFGSHFGVSAGASGAIFGMIGAATVIGVTFKTIPRHVRRVYLMNFLFVASISFLYGVFEPHVDNFAHGGGLVAGVLIGLFVSPSEAPDRRKIVFRIAGVFLGIILLTAAVSATQNAITGSYPRRVPDKWHRVTSRDGWSIEIPRFWSADSADKKHDRFDDGLGSALAVSSQPGPVRLTEGAGEKLKSLTFERIGNYEYEKLVTTLVESNGERETNFSFVTFYQGRSFILQFQCPEEYSEQFGPIVDRLVSGFEVQRSKHQRDVMIEGGRIASIPRHRTY